MKIGIVTTWFERGAAYVSRQFRGVLRDRHEVLIYARGGETYARDDPEWDHDYVTWGRPPVSYASTDINLDDFRDWLIRNGIELVLFNEQLIWAPVLLCREQGIICGSYIDYYTERTVPAFQLYDFLICNTKRHYSVFQNHPQCLYMPWGTDTSLYNYDWQQRDTEKPLYFFTSAGMNPFRKGTDQVIRAFAQVEGNCRLIIHSQVSVREAFPDLAPIIDQLQTQGRLELIEKTVPAPGLYYLGDVYVYPSRLDGIGLTVMEAGASGMPLIVPDNAPMNEFIKENVNGKKVPITKQWSRWDGYYWPQCEVDVTELAGAMEFYVSSSANLQDIRATARKYAETNFDWCTNSQNLSESLETLLQLQQQEVVVAKEAAIKLDRARLQHAAKSKRTLLLENLQSRYPRLYQFIKKN